MDLLGDIGNADQLTSARAENEVLQKRVKELSLKVKELTVENESLKAELEIYQNEAALPNFSKLALGEKKSAVDDGMMDTDDNHQQEDFILTGDGVFPTEMTIDLRRLHGPSNLLCCALHPDDTILATGGADSSLRLCAWGAALAPTPGAAESVVEKAVGIPCGAPVISVAFSQEQRGKALSVVAVGCMDGSVHFIGFNNNSIGGLEAHLLQPSGSTKHGKYVKSIAWSSSSSMVASASADGTITVSKVLHADLDTKTVTVEPIQTLHLSGTVETTCFTPDGTSLVCYTRETPYLSFFDTQDGFKHTKLNLNSGAVAGGFQDHVSFAVMDMCFSPNGGKYLALATDTSRNIILDATTGKQIRNLYGHKNDGFSNPKIAWSRSGQYIFGNHQEDGSICLWDIASSTIVKRLDQAAGGHSMPVRDLFASQLTDTLVTTSFDKSTKLWMVPM